MIEPVALENFFITFFSAALVILSGAGYAALYAWAKLSQRRILFPSPGDEVHLEPFESVQDNAAQASPTAQSTLNRPKPDRSRLVLGLAYACYLLLAMAVFMLARAANLDGGWRIVCLLMLVGYLFAPRAIWHLCAASHE
jgi:hypothetical protein